MSHGDAFEKLQAMAAAQQNVVAKPPQPEGVAVIINQRVVTLTNRVNEANARLNQHIDCLVGAVPENSVAGVDDGSAHAQGFLYDLEAAVERLEIALDRIVPR